MVISNLRTRELRRISGADAATKKTGTVCISLKKMFCKLDMDENAET